MPKHATVPARKIWIGVQELAAKLHCHPMSVPRLVKTKPGFPQPTKLLNKNLWDEAAIDVWIQQQGVTEPAA
jgi:predicted DNA-binding transcriptional regulator AlpA